MSLQLPERLRSRDCPAGRLEYHLRLAALHHNPDGSLVTLAKALNFGSNVFYTGIRAGTLTPAVATAVELLVGRDIAPRELLCPQLAK